MSCSSPIAAWQLAKRGDSGKRIISFKPRGLLSESRISLPCGKCIGCKMERSRGWAIRCVHEGKMHSENCFLTLTYDNDHLPSNGTLIVRDLQLFWKRLHNRLLRSRGYGIRFFSCGEYGDQSQRPHYHGLVFGYMPSDRKLYSRSEHGELWSSVFLDELWGKGAVRIGELNYKTAHYVARYVLKKVDGKKREDGHYLVYDADGVVSERVPEFALMSRNPGIGAPYYAKYGAEIRKHDSLVIDGKAVPSIRYYDLRAESLDLVQFRAIKRERAPKSAQESRDSLNEAIRLRSINEKLLKASLKMKARKI